MQTPRVRRSVIAVFAACLLIVGAVGQGQVQKYEARELVPVREFVRPQFHHGIPYAVAHSYGPEAVPELIEILQNPGLKEQWSNVIWVLGMIGDAEATPVLLDFAQRRFEGEVDRPTFTALLQVNQALGFLAREPGSDAFLFLREGSVAEAWPSRVRWTFGRVSGREQSVLMAQLAINGLGIAASDEAIEYLKELESRVEEKEAILYRDNIREGLEMALRIRELGYERVFSGGYGRQ